MNESKPLAESFYDIKLILYVLEQKYRIDI